MEDEPIIISKTKVQLINPKNPQNSKEEEQKESSNINDPNSQKTKLQENNTNGNYSRIYMQEGQQKKLIYEEKEEVPSEKKGTILKDYSTKKDNKQNEKSHNNRSKGLYNSEIHLIRKSVNRGGNYRNILVTHIINASHDIDFHIIDPLDVSTVESRNRFKIKLNKNNRNGKNGNVKVTIRSSCDNLKIRPKKKKKNISKIEHIPYRENPHLKKINIKKVNNVGNSTMISNHRYNKPLNKNERK